MISTSRIHKDHPMENTIGDINERLTRSHHEIANIYLFSCFLSQTVPKNIIEALKDNTWIDEMLEELQKIIK